MLSIIAGSRFKKQRRVRVQGEGRGARAAGDRGPAGAHRDRLRPPAVGTLRPVTAAASTAQTAAAVLWLRSVLMDPIAASTQTDNRVTEALALILDGRPTSRITAELAAWWRVIRRSVHQGYDQSERRSGCTWWRTT